MKRKVIASLVVACMAVTPLTSFADTQDVEVNTGSTETVTEETVPVEDVTQPIEGTTEDVVEEPTETEEPTASETDETTPIEAEDSDVVREPDMVEGVTAAEDESEPVVKNGWVTENGHRYFYTNNVKAVGMKKINGNLYFFDGNGVMKTGFITYKGHRYYFNSNGTALAKGFKNIGSTKYYCHGNGLMANAPVKIGKNVWMISKSGALMKKKGAFTYYGKEYYGRGNGALFTGWRATKKKAMFYNKNNGAMAKGTTVGYLRIPKNGRLGEAYAYGVRTLNKKGWTLRAAFNYPVKTIKYGNHDYRPKTPEQAALKAFKKKKGNCYCFAGEFYVMAKLMGYDVRQMYGVINKTSPHSWCVINHNGKTLVYDPSFHQHGRINKKSSGFGFKYKTKYTWKYEKIKLLKK